MVYVIIGNGPAGISAIEKIRELDDKGRIILISKEDNQPYSRIMTPEYMTGEVKEEDLFIKGTEVYTRYGVETRLGRVVEKVIPEQKKVILDDKEEIVYDKLLIASGSRPIVPSWVDPNITGVFTLWDKADSEKINQYLSEVKNAVIVGGGLVGLQVARALTTYGIKVTIIEKMNRLMPLQLDETAGSMLKEVLVNKGVSVLLDTEVTALDTDGQKIKAVRTKESEIPVDMVVLSIGVRPNLEMVADTSLEKEQGLIVDEYMHTNIPNIYAAGDIVQCHCRLSGDKKLRALWPCAIQQGKTAGTNMAGANIRYEGSTAMNSFQLFDFSVISFGQIEPTEGMEAKILQHPSSGSYQKLILEGGKLRGLIFVGDIQQAGPLFYKQGKQLNQGFLGSISLNEPESVGV